MSKIDQKGHSARMLVKMIRQAPDDWERTEQLCARAIELAVKDATATTPAGELVGDEACRSSWRGAVSWAEAVQIAKSEPTSSHAIAVADHRKLTRTILAIALQSVANIPTGRNEDVMEGHEQAYRAIEALL